MTTPLKVAAETVISKWEQVRQVVEDLYPHHVRADSLLVPAIQEAVAAYREAYDDYVIALKDARLRKEALETIAKNYEVEAPSALVSYLSQRGEAALL